MNELEWQDVAVGLLVLASALYLVIRLFASFRARSRGCGRHCGACSAPGSPADGTQAPSVTIEQLAASGRKIQDPK